MVSCSCITGIKSLEQGDQVNTIPFSEPDINIKLCNAVDSGKYGTFDAGEQVIDEEAPHSKEYYVANNEILEYAIESCGIAECDELLVLECVSPFVIIKICWTLMSL